MKQTAGAFRALSDATRLRLLGLIGRREVCVCDLMSALRLPQPAVSRHLAYLKRAGLVVDRKAGRWRYYSIVPPSTRLAAALKVVIEASAEADPVVRSARRRMKRGVCR